MTLREKLAQKPRDPNKELLSLEQSRRNNTKTMLAILFFCSVVTACEIFMLYMFISK